MREKAIKKLMANWKDLVDTKALTKEELHESLTEQTKGDVQGWDMSLEELDGDPELAEIMGYDDVDEMTDEQVDEWLGIVIEAAKRYLKKEEE